MRPPSPLSVLRDRRATMRAAHALLATTVFALVVSVAGCNAILGIEDRPLRPDAGAGEVSEGGAMSEDATTEDGTSADGANPVSAYYAAVTADAPIVYLRFGEKTGTVANDEMKALNGTYPTAGVTLGVKGAIANDVNTAVTLDGTVGITMPAGADFAPLAAFTVEIWVRATVDSPSGVSFIVDHETFTTNRGGWELSIGSQVLFERWADGANGGSAVGTPLALGRWHHLVGTYDGPSDGEARLWIDGVVAGVTTGDKRSIPMVPEGWSIGAQNCVCTSNKLQGDVDELAVYAAVLPPDRIVAHYMAAQ